MQHKIVEIIRGNPDYRAFAITKVVDNNFYATRGSIAALENAPEVVRMIFAHAMSIAAIGEVSSHRTEITVKISPAFEGDDGWALIRDHMVPEIKRLFFAETENPEYSLRDDSARYRSRGDDY